jgi:hypothetical protein
MINIPIYAMAEMGIICYSFPMKQRKFSYKGMRVNAFGIPIFSQNRKSRAKTENRKKTFYHITFDSPLKR